jgi:hypothetical protein
MHPMCMQKTILPDKKQSPMSDYGHSDGRYAPMGNTSSVIDGDAVSRAQSVAS